MKIILISDPGKIAGEQALVNALFEEGLEYFHLRKPGFTASDVEKYLKLIDPKFLKRIIIHSHYKIAEKYNIGGFHFPAHFLNDIDKKSYDEILNTARNRRLRTGTSIHTIVEAKHAKKLDYMFISPVFDSISKEGYKSVIQPGAFKKFLLEKATMKGYPEVIALGGVDEVHIPLLKDMGFDGLAILGAIWKDFSKDKMQLKVEKFQKIRDAIFPEPLVA